MLPIFPVMFNVKVVIHVEMPKAAPKKSACNGFNEAVQILLNNGADVNAIDEDNCTALYEAVASGKHDVITELINFQADACSLIRLNVKGMFL